MELAHEAFRRHELRRFVYHQRGEAGEEERCGRLRRGGQRARDPHQRRQRPELLLVRGARSPQHVPTEQARRADRYVLLHARTAAG